MTYIGIDIGGTKCAVTKGEPLRIEKKIHFRTEGYEETIARIFAAVEECMPADAIGISSGGPLDEKKGVILSPPNLPGWDEVPITSMLEERFGIPVYLRNDANACALAEWKHGAGKGTDNMIFLTFGTGLGAGLILDGKLYSGSTGLAGEVGHIRLADKGPCGYGKEGSFEGFCSGGGIAKLAAMYANDELYRGRDTVFGYSSYKFAKYTAKELSDLCKAGDEDAKNVYDISAAHLGKGLSILIDAFNPDAIVIGSIFARDEALFRKEMEKVIATEALPQAARNCRILPAALGESLGDIAALTVAEDGYSGEFDNRALASFEEKLYLPPEKEYEYTYLNETIARYPALSVCRESMQCAIDALTSCVRAGGKIMIAGNGGSSADAEHIAGEFLKGFLSLRTPRGELLDSLTEAIGEDAKKLQGGIPALPLPSFTGVLSAYANDVDPTLVFAQELYALGKKGDVFIGISTSGGAKNVLSAAKVARALGITVIALTGKDGGALKEVADIAIIAPARETYKIQEYHLPIYHALCADTEKILFGTSDAH